MGHAASAACFCAFAAAGYGMFGTCCATAFTVTLVAASPLLGRLVTVALLADTLLMVPEWLGPVVRISLGWFGREVSHVGASNPSPNPNPDPDPDPTPTPTPTLHQVIIPLGPLVPGTVYDGWYFPAVREPR